jgi:hypothetical protein
MRRKLLFASLEQVTPDVERLLAGHVTLGRWSLGQICNHLALALRLSMEGVPEKEPWLLRRTVGPLACRLSLWLHWIPEGVKVHAVYLPEHGLDACREAEALRTAIERYRSFTGRLDEHPLLGRMSPAQWERFHCLHCSHHLSFAVPTAQPQEPQRRPNSKAV